MIEELVKIRNDEIYNSNIERIDREIILLKEELMKMNEEEFRRWRRKWEWISRVDDPNEEQLRLAKEEEDDLIQNWDGTWENLIDCHCSYAHDYKVNGWDDPKTEKEHEEMELWEEELNKMDDADLLVFWRTTKNNVVPPTYKSTLYVYSEEDIEAGNVRCFGL